MFLIKTNAYQLLYAFEKKKQLSNNIQKKTISKS